MESNILPFVEYVREDKSKYVTATTAGYYDPDGDFLIGSSGGFLLNIGFIFVNTYLLREAGSHYEKFGEYTDLIEDTPSHRRFRTQEETRRKNGYTAKCKLLYKDINLYNSLIKQNKLKDAEELVKPLRITGEHYNFINYGILSKLDTKSVTISKSGKVSGKKHDGIAEFFGAQYWWYKSKEFGKNNGFHLILGKARRGGFSYMEGDGSANTINLNPFATVIHAGYEFKYLTEGRAITRMSLMQLQFYELHTPFKRGFISRDMKDIQLGFKRKDGANDGYQSHLLSLAVGTTNPDVAVGKDAIEIKCEELSLFSAFDEFMEVTEPTTRTGSVVTGSIIAWGTGGSKDAKWEAFESNYYNPNSRNFMPFENVWDKNSRDRVCGFFKPYIESLQGFTRDGKTALDKDGNTDYEIAMQISEEERTTARAKAKTVQEFIIYCGQYANMPSESFSSTTDNLFASEELNNHIFKVRHNPEYKFYTDGMIVDTSKGFKFKSNFKLHDEGLKTHPYIEDVPAPPTGDKYGCLRIWQHPFVDTKTGKIPDIYDITYDPVGKDKDKPTSKNSYNSISIWMNPNVYFHNVTKLRIGNYFGRPQTMEEADMIARDICYFFGGHPGMMMAEINRGETKSNFRKWGCVNLLAKSPVVVWDTKIKSNMVNEYGLDLSNDVRKLQGLHLLKALMYKRIGENEDGTDRLVLETIPDLSYLLEMQKWNPDGNFDRVSDAILEAFMDKKAEVTAAIKLKAKTKVVESILTREWA